MLNKYAYHEEEEGHYCRDVGDEWAGWAMPTQVLADQLTLSQSDGADCVPYITTCPPSFR